MSITTKCRFVVGTIDGKSVSYIVDQPIKQPPSSSYFDRPLTSNLAASKSESHSHNRPSTTSASIAANNEEPNEAKINASVTLSNNQLDELMEILQQHQGKAFVYGKHCVWPTCMEFRLCDTITHMSKIGSLS